jgi:hypothetical protein
MLSAGPARREYRSGCRNEGGIALVAELEEEKMNASLAFQKPIWLLLGSVALCAAQPCARAADEVNGVTAVSSRVSKDYVRTRLPDGSFQPESYSLGEGGSWGGEISDATIDKVKFIDVARVIAGPLANQKYLPSKDPNKVKLLIMVYWGTTAVPARPDMDPQYQEYYQLMSEAAIATGAEKDALITSALHVLSSANHQREILDFRNAAMLGYDSSGLIGTEYGRYIEHTALGREQRDQVAEIEENRYFVVLMAYDFQLLWKQKKHKLLWETRFSINERHNQFDKALPVMAQYASRYFGQGCNGLLRTRVPEGRVEVGEPRSLGEVPEK